MSSGSSGGSGSTGTGSGGSGSSGSGSSGTGSSSGGSGGPSAPRRRIGIAIVLGGIAGGLVALANIANIGTWLVGSEVLCRFGILKCSNPPEPRPVIPAPPTTVSSSPSPDSPKSDSTPSSSPISNSSPAPETPAPVSPSPSAVKLSADEKPCTVEQNGSTVNLEFLNRSCTFTGNFNSNNQERIYRFKIDNPSNITLYLGNVNSEVEMFLYEDQSGTGVISGRIENRSAINSRMGIIDRQLSVGNYIVAIRSKVRETPYSLQIVNNTSQAKNLEFLQGTIPLNGSVSSKNQQRYYRFQLANPSDINLSLDGVNSEVEMFIYEDQSGTGVISGRIENRSAFKDQPAIIKRNLSVGHYIVVIGFKARETDYILTMSAP
ncbi:hypothetical protein [Microcoleus sp. herbarium5]|uniref:hypothetical protein n=1 Tax=Microcoleus sp. herbarium5 TaxID=3055434 RepID=UPI002FD05E1B